MLEYVWLVPRVRGELPFDPAYSDEQVLDAFVQVAQPEMKWFRSHQAAHRDVEKGERTVELYRYSETPTSIGFAAYAEIDRRKRVVKFVVKGAGPYFGSLPVRKVTQAIACNWLARPESGRDRKAQIAEQSTASPSTASPTGCVQKQTDPSGAP